MRTPRYQDRHLFSLLFFVVLVWMGFQRYFEISDDKDLLLSRGLVPGYAGKDSDFKYLED
jgi:hypothetical protein